MGVLSGLNYFHMTEVVAELRRKESKLTVPLAILRSLVESLMLLLESFGVIYLG